MKIPRWEKAVVAEHKIKEYLLSTKHPLGRHKAAFFAHYGFGQATWAALADALRKHGGAHPIAAAEDTPFGTRYIVNGPLLTPSGRSVPVRSVWFVEAGDDVPRFVTAYPLRKERP